MPTQARLSACALCQAHKPLMEDLHAGAFNRSWACHDCPARILHGVAIKKPGA